MWLNKILLKNKLPECLQFININRYEVPYPPKRPDLYQELAEYTHMPYHLVWLRCQYAYLELAYQWYRQKPKSDKQFISYYKKTDYYIYDLTCHQEFFTDNIKKILLTSKQYKIKKALNFGGGIGELAIKLEKMGIKVDFLEIKNSQTMKYALWRFKKHKVNPKILNENSRLRLEYDAIYLFDVLEHIKNPQSLIKKFAKITKYLFDNPGQMPFNLWFPQHISKYNLTKYFSEIKPWLWRSKLT